MMAENCEKWHIDFWLTLFILCGLPLLTSCSKDETDDEQQPQKVTQWECILFGSYPANEVVIGSFSAVDDYALVDGDVIADAAVLPALTIDLTKASWTVATPVMSTDIVQ